MYKNLRFFKGLDYDLNLEQDSNGIWNGVVFLPEVSVGLYETINMFIVEECIFNGDPLINAPVGDASWSYGFQFEWEDAVQKKVNGDNSHSTDIIMFGIDDEGNQPVIKEYKEQYHELIDNSIVDSTNDDGVKVINTKNNVAIQINIAINSNDDTHHRRTLLITEIGPDGSKRLVANIVFYGETVGEDERLKILLRNFGAALEDSDFMLFKSHDISEMSPDFILLNAKRKELLLELHNIKPFVGTYKAVLNAIDFYGYSKLTLKEYWLNIDNKNKNFGKLFAVPVANSSKRGESIRKRLKFKLPSNTMKKTSKFSLVYTLNEPNGTFDQWDIPNVTETFDYTPEEILIKLYGLKNKLQKEYMPLKAKIIDITAEGDYFTQRNLNVWNNQNPISYFSEGHDIKFKVLPENRNLFIEDTSLVLKSMLDQDDLTSNYDTFLNMKFGEEGNLSSEQLVELKEIYKEFYNTYYNRELNSYNEGIPIGCPIILDGRDSFDSLWEDAKFTWEDTAGFGQGLDPIPNGLEQIHSGISWENWWKSWVYEIEWVITSKERGYNQTFRGPIDDFISFPITLPYADSYDVEMRTYDLFGHRSYYRTKNLIEVQLKELEIYGIYKWLEKNEWNQKNNTWNKSGGYWDVPQDNQTKIEDNISTYYLTLDRANYVHFKEDQGLRFSTVRRYVDIYSESGFSETTGPYQWGECSFRWKDTEHNWWDAMRVGPDLTSSFKINNIEQGHTLFISHKNPKTLEIETGEHTIASPTPTNVLDLNGWNTIAEELNTSTDPIISKFNYNPVFEDIDNVPVSGDVFRFLLAVGKEYSKTYDFETVANTDNSISGEIHCQHYNPTWDDTRVFKDYAEVERSTHLTISTDISKFPGSSKPIWKIKNISNPEITDIYYNNMWLTYIFQQPGSYSIELETEDTYGNKNVVKRNMLKVK
jgi:hypothetical protein